MKKRLKHFLKGIRQVLVLNPESGYRRPQKGDSAQDMLNLRGDFEHVSRDMCSAVDTYGKQNQYR